MSVTGLSRMTQDYLQVIWKATEWDPAQVSVNDVADRLGVTRSTASSGIKRLTADGLVRHEKYGAVELTDSGRAAAVQMVRRHRLLESFLANHLGYSWDQVHDEAEHLEHTVSDLFIERLDEALGHPDRDPHGDAIPTANGQLAPRAAALLSTLRAGQCGVLTRVSDERPEVLRYLADAGLRLDAHLRVRESDTEAGTVTVELAQAPDSGPTVTLTEADAAQIRVAPDGHPESPAALQAG